MKRRRISKFASLLDLLQDEYTTATRIRDSTTTQQELVLHVRKSAEYMLFLADAFPIHTDWEINGLHIIKKANMSRMDKIFTRCRAKNIQRGLVKAEETKQIQSLLSSAKRLLIECDKLDNQS